MAGNLEKLTQGGVIADESRLSDAERKVLQELEPEEVELLLRMRKKLDEAVAETGTAGLSDAQLSPSPSVIV